MDRETRKANLKKLQLPTTSGYKQRTGQTAKHTTTPNTAITNYFLTPEKRNNIEEEITSNVNKFPSTLTDFKHNEPPESFDININPITRSRAKRTKLDAFIFKDKKKYYNSIKNLKDDFIPPEKKAKTAPNLKRLKSSKKTVKSRDKNQTTIKSAFLRNEELFAEIAAQHCAADQFDGDDVQLALALSQSEAECKRIKAIDDNAIYNRSNVADSDEAASIREKLKKYGFRTAETKDYNTFAAAFLPKTNSRRSKSKWANKFTALTLRSSEIQMKKLQGNVENLLNSKYHNTQLNDEEKILPHYKLQSPLLKKSVAHEYKRVLRNAQENDQSYESFFVSELFEINRLPAGYLLKDWSNVQGRDLTPNPKNKQSRENATVLQNIYQDLEEFFSSRKRLDWTSIADLKKDEVLTNKNISNCKEERHKEDVPVVVEMLLNSFENVATNAMVEPIKDLQSNQKTHGKNTEIRISASATNNSDISKLLPITKTLDRMQVSSCCINSTQATVNSTQNNRSNSPDIFADSDVEMEETEETDQNKTTEAIETVITATQDKSGKCSFDCVQGDVVTYEIFSSDEVKNTTILELNKSAEKESSKHNSPNTNNAMDLIQEDLQTRSANNIPNDNFTQSKSIEEIDLFAESPLLEAEQNTDDTPSISQQSKYVPRNKEETCKFTLSMETSDKERQVLENEMEAFLELSPSLEIEEKLELFDLHQTNNDDDVFSHEIAMHQRTALFLNFQRSKQLETSCHKETDIIQTDSITDNLKGNDTIFQELCKKYLHQESFEANSLQNKNFTKSFTQIPPRIKTPQRYDKFTMDLNIGTDKSVTFRRKSISFSANPPSELDIDSAYTFLSKSHSFNKLNSNISIDLTQSDIEENNVVDKVELAAEDDDDDCVVLSDDEINYSIWQANKTLNLEFSFQSTKHQDDIISLSDNEEDQNDDQNQLFHPDLITKEKFLIKNALGSENEDEFENITSKYIPKRLHIQDEAKFDRSEFGILEEYSEPIDFTPNFCTPTKVLSEASFLTSPTETTAPMKRYTSRSKSSQKFQELLKNIEEKSPPYFKDNFSEFDEFDRLVGSPLKSVSLNKKPVGIDQLLTAEISFKESQKTSVISKGETSLCLENSTQEIKYKNKIYKVRYITSPKPDYTKYTESELLKQLYNFGIKPLKRKQAVKILEYIYNQTHPILMNDREESAEKQHNVIKIADDSERPCTSRKVPKDTTSISKPRDEHFINFPNESEKEVAVNLMNVPSNKLNLQDSCGLEMLRYSNDLKPELSDEIYILQTNVTKKTAQPLLPFHIAWYNLVCSNRKLHENILMYVPVDLQEVYLFLKTLGYRYDPKDLKTFFDRRCIIFRYDLTTAAGSSAQKKVTNRHVRKPKSKIIKN